MFGEVIKQILLGLGIAAGNATFRTFGQLSMSAISSQMQSWGVNLEPGSPLGIFMNNLFDEFGDQITSTVMQASGRLHNKIINPLEERAEIGKAYINNQAKLVGSNFSDYISLRNSLLAPLTVLNAGVEPFGMELEVSKRAINQANAFASKEIKALEYKKDRILGNKLRVVKNVGDLGGGYSQGVGTNNTAGKIDKLQMGGADDNKLYNSIQALINMEKK